MPSINLSFALRKVTHTHTQEYIQTDDRCTKKKTVTWVNDFKDTSGPRTQNEMTPPSSVTHIKQTNNIIQHTLITKK